MGNNNTSKVDISTIPAINQINHMIGVDNMQLSTYCWTSKPINQL